MRAETAERLTCPACRERLQPDRGDADLIDANLTCPACGRTFPLRDGVGVLLADPAAQDVWRDASLALDAALAKEPAVRRQLLASAPDELNGADLTFRGMVLESRGDVAAAAEAFAAADPKLYAGAQRACRDRLLDAAVERAGSAEWVVDIASGRGALVERLARAGSRVLATDISPVAMIRLRNRLSSLGLLDRVDCLACDAAALPFGDATVPAITSYVGLQNIPRPQGALQEIRRACAGPMLIVGHTYPVDDRANGVPLGEHGYAHVADRAVLDVDLVDAGWNAAYPETCRAPALPTPVGSVIAGGVVDGFPVAPTTLDWFLLEAHPAAESADA